MISRNLQILHTDRKVDNSTENLDRHMTRIVEICHNSSRQALATLIRLLGDLDLAESTLQEVIKVANKHWQQQGIPSNPRDWLISKAYSNAMHNLRFVDNTNETNHIAAGRQNSTTHLLEIARSELCNDQLCLIFLCCHPIFNDETKLVLTLHIVCRLPVSDIASVLLIPQRVVTQRIMRAKIRIREQYIKYEIPTSGFFLERLNSILHILHLIFNIGYQMSFDRSQEECDLSREALQICRWLLELLPSESEIKGLLALMLLHNARETIQSSIENDLVLLSEHDRSLWKRNQINESKILIGQALDSSCFGTYTLQAAIATVHAEAPNSEKTEWYRIIGLYDLLMRINPVPLVEFNRTIALAKIYGYKTGLAMTESLLQRGLLHECHFMYAARANYFSCLGQTNVAIKTYEYALELAQLESDRRFIECRIAELSRSKQTINSQ